ncbi:MAG: nitrite reductase small subunit NirD [Pseudomonadota bacterium]
MTNWIDIADLNEVPRRGARVVKTRDGCVAIFRTAADEVFALDNACPHKQGPLADGIVHGASVTCPLHNWVISLETGLVQGEDNGQVSTYPARAEGGRILLDATFLRARAVA